MKTRLIISASWLFAVTGLSAASLSVDPARSSIAVDAKATGHSFRGNLTKFSATVSGNPDTLLPSAVALSWNFSDLKTGEGKRDAEMLKWLSHANQPNGSFRMTKSWIADGNPWVQGTLKIHGVSKSISFPLKAKKDGKRLAIDGSVWIDYQDFSLPIIRNMAVMTVDPKLKISFHLEGDLK